MKGMIRLSAFVLMAVGLSGVMARAQEGKGLWGVKPVPLETVLHKAQFQVVLPKPLSSQFTLQKAEIAWVQPYDDASRGRFPARQMICLFYKIQGKGTMDGKVK